MQTLVTRPEPQASVWAADLSAQGLLAHALPLIAIDGPKDLAPVQATWTQLHRHRLLMFVSPSAVEWFFRLRPSGAAWAPGTLAATPGPGTARALLQAGGPWGLQASQVICPPDQAAQFDSEALWPLLSPLNWAGQSVAIISGGDDTEVQGRTWLAQQWQARGAQVHAVLSYRRSPGAWLATQQALARQALLAPSHYAWLLSSSQGIANLLQHHLPALGHVHPDWPHMTAVCTHPNIAEQARQAGFGRIVASKPTLDAVVQSLRQAQTQSIQ